MLLPSTAMGSTELYKGFVTGGGTVKFKAVVKDGRVTKIKGGRDPDRGLTFTGVMANCDQGPKPIEAMFLFPIEVIDRHFKATATNPAFSQVLKTKGTFRHHGHKVSGTLHATAGDIVGVGTNCDTGKVDWRASRQ